LKDDFIAQQTALIRYHYPNIDVDKLSDAKWANLVEELWYTLKTLGIMQETKTMPQAELTAYKKDNK
jgi:hypothetical protein